MSSSVIPKGWNNAHATAHEITHNQTVPIYFIPPEIIGQFFCWGKRLSMDPRYDDQAPSYNFEVAVSHVGRHLRNVAINTPSLWTDIDSTLLKSPDAFDTYLKRSGSLPLDIRLGARGRVALGDLLDVLIPKIDRWRSLSVSSWCMEHDGSLFTRLRDRKAPSLEHFSIYATSQDHFNGASPEVLIGGARALSFVRLGNCALSSLRPPLTSVVTLHIDQPHPSIDYEQLCQILIAASPSLANLSILGDVTAQEMWLAANTENQIHMPALRALRIGDITGFTYCGILLNISAPELESLFLKDVKDGDLEQLSDSPQMIPLRYKFPALRSLTVCDFECSPAAYLRLFTAFPAITHFMSIFTPLQSQICTRLITFLEGGGTQCYHLPRASSLDGCLPWPNLDTIAFAPLDCLDLDHIIDMIKVRKRLGHPIAELRLGAASEDITSYILQNLTLEECVTVEGFSDVDPWPAELRYSDYDDHF